MVWLILVVLLLLAGVFTYLILNPARRHKPVVPSLATPTDPDTQALNDQLDELGDQFGGVMEHQRDTQPLIDKINALIAEHPGAPEAHTLLGQVLIFAGRFDDGLAELKQSLKLNPDQPNVHELAGTTAATLGRLDEAEHQYTEAMRLDPDNPRHAVFLATVQHKLGRDDQAIATLINVVQHDAGQHAAYALLSDIYAGQGKLGLALDQAQRAIDALNKPNSPTFVLYTRKRAKLLRQDKQPAESLALLTALPEKAQTRPDVMRDIAESWDMLGKPALAAQLYEQALTADPTNDLAAAEATRWWLKAGDPEAAQRTLAALRRINPRHPDLPKLDAEINGK